MTYRAAVIGCGLIGSGFADTPPTVGIYTHASAYRACPATELIAVCDANPARLDACGDRWGVTMRFTSLDALLAEAQPEIVSLCTPDATHGELLMRIVQAPSVRAVLAEKPLAATLDQARAVVADARARGVQLAVNYSRRYAAGIDTIAARIRAGELGAIQAVSGYYTKGVRHNGSHWFDLARMMCGEIVAVRAWPGAGGDFADDPTLSVQVRFDAGIDGVLQGLDANRYSLFEMDILGSRGRLRLSDAGHRLEVSHAGDSPHYAGYLTLLPEPPQGCDMKDTLLHAVADIVACLDDNREPACSGDDGCAALAVAEAAIAAATSGTWIEVPNIDSGESSS